MIFKPPHPALNASRSSRGFTIIETLVAVTVLMIAIAGPLVVASKGLFGALASKDQLTASYLAQESMEVIKNIRDNNLVPPANPDWLAYNGISLDNCQKNSPCDASAVSAQEVVTGGHQLYLSPAGSYNHDSLGLPSIFYRSFFITKPSNTGSCPYNSSNECRVTVVVSWNEGATPYSIAISSELADATR